MAIPLGFRVTMDLPINIRKKWKLLDRRVRSHFVRAKHYQHLINLCQHLKWQTPCHGTNIQIDLQRSNLVWGSCKAIEAEQRLDSIQALVSTRLQTINEISNWSWCNTLPKKTPSTGSVKTCYNAGTPLDLPFLRKMHLPKFWFFQFHKTWYNFKKKCPILKIQNSCHS